jgi:hypothetical protein
VRGRRAREIKSKVPAGGDIEQGALHSAILRRARFFGQSSRALGDGRVHLLGAFVLGGLELAGRMKIRSTSSMVRRSSSWGGSGRGLRDHGARSWTIRGNREVLTAKGRTASGPADDATSGK